jgi:REP element-mobilizing transposase RayT
MGNYHQLYYHISWATDERQPMIDSELRKPLHEYLKGKTIAMGGIAFAVGGVTEHVHLCLTIPPHIAISKFIGQLKGASSHWVNHIARPGGLFRWQDGYGIFTVSKERLDRIITYINNQEIHHRGATVAKDWEIE